MWARLRDWCMLDSRNLAHIFSCISVRLDRMLVARIWPPSCSYFGIEGFWCRLCSMRVEIRRDKIQGYLSHLFMLQARTTFLVFMQRNVGFTFLRTGGGACSRNLAHLKAQDCTEIGQDMHTLQPTSVIHGCTYCGNCSVESSRFSPGFGQVRDFMTEHLMSTSIIAYT